MSKERVLLKEFIDFVDSYEFYPTERNIIFEIVNRANAILAQPEQTEQEPVATKLESHQFTAFHVSADDFKKLQKLPTGTKIYTAPPKREPLSDKEITKNTPKLIHIGERLAFHAGVRFAEKHHGIGGEE